MPKVFHPLRVQGQKILLTGSSGALGKQYSEAFLRAGNRVAGLDLVLSGSARRLLQKFPRTFRWFPADVRSRESLQEAWPRIRRWLGVPTVLINNAALDSPPSAPAGENGPFENYPEESWRKVLDVNLTGIFFCCQVFGGAMAKAGRGSIINIGSIYGMVSPDPRLYEYRHQKGERFYKPVAYSASKSGIYNLSRYLAVYWAPRGVRVNSLTLAGVWNHQHPKFLQAYLRRIPIGRMARPGDYLGPIFFLASPGSQYMTGANLVVDGGWTAL